MSLPRAIIGAQVLESTSTPTGSQVPASTSTLVHDMLDASTLDHIPFIYIIIP